jgi:hypothetical protein
MASSEGASTPIKTSSRRHELLKNASDLAESYGALNAEQTELMRSKGVVGRYDYARLASYKVLFTYHMSVFSYIELWKETFCMAILFWGVFLFLYFERPKNFGQVVGSESGIRAFLGIFSTLIGLLISFYTANTLGRWWQMRLAIESIQDGCKELTMLVSQGVSDDEILLDGISRYARASLYLIFLVDKKRDAPESALRQIHECGLITKEEYELMNQSCPHSAFVQAETFWVWLGNAITRAHKQGLSQGPPHYCALMAAVSSGRKGITSIKSYLDTPIPIGYIHLLCWIVKLHNILLTVMSALLAVKFSGGKGDFQPVPVFRAAFKAFFMPFLYNAILCLNSECTDPFGGDEGDFNWNIYDVNMTTSVRTYVAAAEHIPDWVVNTKFEPIKMENV